MTPITAMKLNHLSFPTDDVEATTDFFATYLGFTVAMRAYPTFAFLKRPGFDVVIELAADQSPTRKSITTPAAANAFRDCVSDDPGAIAWPMVFHVGFELPTVEDVRALYDRLTGDGYGAESEVFNHDRGSRFMLRAPGGVLFEFNTRSDAALEFQGTFNN